VAGETPGAEATDSITWVVGAIGWQLVAKVGNIESSSICRPGRDQGKVTLGYVPCAGRILNQRKKGGRIGFLIDMVAGRQTGACAVSGAWALFPSGEGGAPFSDGVTSGLDICLLNGFVLLHTVVVRLLRKTMVHGVRLPYRVAGFAIEMSFETVNRPIN